MQYSSVDNNVQQQHLPDVTNNKFLKISPCCKTAWCKIGQGRQGKRKLSLHRAERWQAQCSRGQNRVEAGGKQRVKQVDTILPM